LEFYLPRKKEKELYTESMGFTANCTDGCNIWMFEFTTACMCLMIMFVSSIEVDSVRSHLFVPMLSHSVKIDI